MNRHDYNDSYVRSSYKFYLKKPFLQELIKRAYLFLPLDFFLFFLVLALAAAA
tara:strand:+ start:205 stop:363 length:159 start_codon:yes stop_codon:yes gene_type:complete